MLRFAKPLIENRVNFCRLWELPLDQVRDAETAVREAVTEELSEVCDRIVSGEKLRDEDLEAILRVENEAVQAYKPRVVGQPPEFRYTPHPVSFLANLPPLEESDN